MEWLYNIKHKIWKKGISAQDLALLAFAGGSLVAAVGLLIYLLSQAL